MNSNRIRKVSIGLPTRNSIRFLEERIDSILSQTFLDWELIVVDGQSADGTWEALNALSARDTRVKITQAAPDGIYPNFNRCIGGASGTYVYIATSDDTMASDFLEQMVEALDENPDCEIAHCPLRILNDTGKEMENWWQVNSLFVRSTGVTSARRHLRPAPLDGILCLLGDNIYTSVTQLLIRRSLFDRVGLYQSDWGSVGDFHWNLRAGLVASSIHVPETWASWRMHMEQATAGAGLGSVEHSSKIESMIRDVLENQIGMLDSDLARRLNGRLGCRLLDVRAFLRGLPVQNGALGRLIYALRSALAGSECARNYLISKALSKANWPWSGSNGIEELVVEAGVNRGS